MASQVKAREFTKRGIRRARRFLDEVRERPEIRSDPPRALLEGSEYTRPFSGNLTVDRRRRRFASRREAGEYLAPKLSPFRPWIADRMSLWSWLGVFYFRNTVRIVDGAAKLSPLDETFVIDRSDKHNYRGRHRHYLRAAWQLYESHGDHAAFLLNQPPWARGDIADRILQSQPIFNSVGIVPLILGLYTDGNRPKRGSQGRPGGLRHLRRVLPQLERTYDIYGMPPHSLVRILPPEFEPWIDGLASGGGTSEDPGPETSGTAAGNGSPATPVSRSGAEATFDTTEAEVDQRDPPQWEATVRESGLAEFRYKRFRTTVTIDDATGTLRGRVFSPSAWPIGSVSASTPQEFERLAKGEVDAYLARATT